MLNMKYLVLSLENFCIFTYTDSQCIAQALSVGNGDTSIVGLTRANCAWYDQIQNRNQFYEKIILFDHNAMTELPMSSVDESWRRTQDLLRLRQPAFHLWESITQEALGRIEQHVWDQFDLAVCAELSQCDPEKDQYTWLVEDYARTMELPVEQAYRHLRLRSESDRVYKFKIATLSEKFRQKINRASTQQEIKAVTDQMRREFWGNSRI